MLQSAAIGAGRNPRFWGGSLSSPRIFLYQHAGSRLVGTNHGKQKSLRKAGMLHHPHFSCYTPPFVPVTKNAVVCNMKNTPDLAPQTGSENRVARNVE